MQYDLDTSDFSTTGYNRFRTPYFRISIAPYNNPKNLIELPAELYKLIQKIEIIESWASESCALENFNIVFAEGSREPFASSEQVDTSDLYGGLFTNSPGFLTDLRFSNNGSEILSITPLVEETINKIAPSTSAPIYLFQEGNIVTVEWGYREDPKNARIIANAILMVQSDFPETGVPIMTLSCQSPFVLLDQITTPVGKNYKVASSVTLNEAGEEVVDYTDVSTLDLLQGFADDHGFDLRISDSILNDTLDKNASKAWVAGMSFGEFLKKLARLSNCIFKVYFNPKNGYNYTIAFISRAEYISKSSVPDSDQYLFRYKGANSILRSFSIKADFAGLPSTAVSGVDSNGKLQVQLTDTGDEQTVQFGENSYLPDMDPSSKSDVVKSINSTEANHTDTTAGKIPPHKTAVSPMADNVKTLDDHTLAAFGRCGNKLISVEFSMLGYTHLFAGQVVTFSNVGTRYSKSYFVQNVTHIIDSTGYHLRGTAFGNNLGGQKGIVPKNPKLPESPESTTVDIKQFADATRATKSDPVAEHQDDLFVS